MKINYLWNAFWLHGLLISQGFHLPLTSPLSLTWHSISIKYYNLKILIWADVAKRLYNSLSYSACQYDYRVRVILCNLSFIFPPALYLNLSRVYQFSSLFIIPTLSPNSVCRENVLIVLKEALEEADMSPDKIDAVAYTKGEYYRYWIRVKTFITLSGSYFGKLFVNFSK